MPTRWNLWYSAENLNKDPRILSARPTYSAEKAADLFLSRRLRRILDLGCGVGRDTLYLSDTGLQVFGADAAYNGVHIARQRSSSLGLPADFLAVDARRLPFKTSSMDGVYCFGLLHEFTGAIWKVDVHYVMGEIRRILQPGGVLVLTVAAGAPEAGLPQVQLYSRAMFEKVAADWDTLEITSFTDIGCTGRTDYMVWYGAFEINS